MKSTRQRSAGLAAKAIAILAAIALSFAPPIAYAAGFAPVPAMISGKSPDQLGTWTVHYQRVAGGDEAVTGRINEHLDAEANRQVQQATWDGSTRHPWTFDSNGTLTIGTVAVSELFTTQYNTNEPHMPVLSVASMVLDGRSGVRITWDNLFVDKQAGLSRLSEATEAAMAAVAPPTWLRDWRLRGEFAPIDINYRAWIATAEGIELHFPQYQFGGGLKAVTVPWARVADLIAPEFAPIMSS